MKMLEKRFGMGENIDGVWGRRPQSKIVKKK
jgi:hypothetical protein